MGRGAENLSPDAPPFTRHLRVLRDRLEWLENQLEENPGRSNRSYIERELNALVWALPRLEAEAAEEANRR